jgi:hypothetical protein
MLPLDGLIVEDSGHLGYDALSLGVLVPDLAPYRRQEILATDTA